MVKMTLTNQFSVKLILGVGGEMPTDHPSSIPLVGFYGIGVEFMVVPNTN